MKQGSIQTIEVCNCSKFWLKQPADMVCCEKMVCRIVMLNVKAGHNRPRKPKWGNWIQNNFMIMYDSELGVGIPYTGIMYTGVIQLNGWRMRNHGTFVNKSSNGESSLGLNELMEGLEVPSVGGMFQNLTSCIDEAFFCKGATFDLANIGRMNS